ncbi:MAG: tRNA-dihydrouridine synthase family protein [Candidatus Micrarchaeia archaeon]
MKYGNSTLSGKFVLGPMAAYTDIAYRLLCRRRGAAMGFTEFANANAVVRGGEESWRLMQTCSDEMPVGIQIFGSDEKIMADACRQIGKRVSDGWLSASCIDINFGCPAGSVIRAGAGSALLKKPERIFSIVSACAKATDIPITAKIRAGWGTDKAVEIAKGIENSGACGLTVHWRTATEGRKRTDGWMAVAEVKNKVSIPVIGNGGASTPERAVQFLKETGCDAVMISSAALGNPGIFARANECLKGNEILPATWEEKLADFMEYRSLAQKHNVLAPKRLRAHAIEFVTGFEGVKIARKKLNAAKTVDEIGEIMLSFVPQ